MKLKELKESIDKVGEEYLVVNKPFGVTVLDDRSGAKGLLELVRQLYPSAQACHRIDKDTSGAVLFALNPDAYRHASIQFQNRKIKKVYHALVHGRAEFQELKEARRIMSSENSSWTHINGKDSLTYFQTLEMFKNHTFVECRPVTGRMHQIRVHLQALEHPIVSDILYGGEDLYLSEEKKKFNIGKYEDERPIMGRLALHAYSLEFEDRDNITHKVEKMYPKDLKATLNQLRKMKK